MISVADAAVKISVADAAAKISVADAVVMISMADAVMMILVADAVVKILLADAVVKILLDKEYPTVVFCHFKKLTYEASVRAPLLSILCPQVMSCTGNSNNGQLLLLKWKSNRVPSVTHIISSLTHCCMRNIQEPSVSNLYSIC